MTKPTPEQIRTYADENQAVAAYHRAEAALCENTAREATAGITHETSEYLRLNAAVIDAAARLPERFKHLAED
ncbi:hypothetical protein [Streptomyces prasinopilosus]|uniref:hypothetical protein n=1 Tax=Streptomyces prasinopilosus TaxID=67344 RepID=UPI0006EBD597|nr:hypothetical protein [Streptomyces prasinopilosus]